MELALPTPVSRPPSLKWHPHTARHTQGAKVAKVAKVAVHHLKEKARPSGGHATRCAGNIQGKEGRIQVLAGLAPSSQTVESNKRVIYEQAEGTS